jgi:predicted ATP-grasp superfamily ATP-dependent carboligase
VSHAPKGRVLVLDAHTMQALASVRSLGRAGYTVLVASHRRRAVAAWSRFCRGRFLLSGETVAAYSVLRLWAWARGVTAVLPMTERSCVLCNADRDAWEAAGITVGCGPESMLRQTFDKAATMRAAAACGVRIPPTRFPESLEDARAAARELGFPCVVKARSSNAWDGRAFLPDGGVSYAGDEAQLEAAMLAHRQGPSWPLIQGIVPGQGMGVSALFEHGRPVAWFAHERLRDVRPSGSGSSLRRSLALNPRLLEPAERLLTALRWHGPAMVEFRDDGSESPWLIEVNGRFWGSLQLAISAGVDVPRLWMDVLRGATVAGGGPPASYAAGVTVRWLWGDVKRFLYILGGRPRGYPGRYPTALQGLKELLGPQPPGTRIETWEPGDPWPAVGELIQGIADLRRAAGRTERAPAFGTPAPAPAPAVPAADPRHAPATALTH